MSIEDIDTHELFSSENSEDSENRIVRCEPSLERYAAGLTPSERRELARVYYRWARQLCVTADALEKPRWRN